MAGPSAFDGGRLEVWCDRVWCWSGAAPSRRRRTRLRLCRRAGAAVACSGKPIAFQHAGQQRGRAALRCSRRPNGACRGNSQRLARSVRCDRRRPLGVCPGRNCHPSTESVLTPLAKADFYTADRHRPGLAAAVAERPAPSSRGRSARGDDVVQARGDRPDPRISIPEPTHQPGWAADCTTPGDRMPGEPAANPTALSARPPLTRRMTPRGAEAHSSHPQLSLEARAEAAHA